MLLHLVAAEQFRSQRWFVGGVLLYEASSSKTRNQMEQGPTNGLAVRVQV
jgi:hypothetical protein